MSALVHSIRFYTHFLESLTGNISWIRLEKVVIFRGSVSIENKKIGKNTWEKKKDGGRETGCLIRKLGGHVAWWVNFENLDSFSRTWAIDNCFIELGVPCVKKKKKREKKRRSGFDEYVFGILFYFMKAKLAKQQDEVKDGRKNKLLRSFQGWGRREEGRRGDKSISFKARSKTCADDVDEAPRRHLQQGIKCLTARFRHWAPFNFWTETTKGGRENWLRF